MNTATDMMASKPLARVQYTARVHTTGGRDGGVSKSDDGRLDIKHSIPGTPGKGPIPNSYLRPAGPHVSKAPCSSSLIRPRSNYRRRWPSTRKWT